MAQFALMFLALGYIIHFFIENRHDLKILYDLNWAWLGAIVFFYNLGVIILAYRFRIVLQKCCGKTISFWSWFRIFVLGSFFNRLIPQAGNLYKGHILKKEHQISYTCYISSYAAFIWIDLLMNLVIAFVIVALTNPTLKLADINLLSIFGILFIAVILIPVFLKLICGLTKSKLESLDWISTKILQVTADLMHIFKDRRFLYKLAIVWPAAFINGILIFYVSFKSIDIDVPVSVITTFVIILKLSNMIIITPGNLGVRELAYGLLGQLSGIGMAQALIVALITRLIATLAAFFFGTLFGGWHLIRCKEQSQQL